MKLPTLRSDCPTVSHWGRTTARGARTVVMAVLGVSLGLLLLSAKLGCRPTDPESSLPDPLAANKAQGGTQLRQALDFLNRLDEFDQATAQAEILRSLQEWLSGQATLPDWSPDPLIEQLPDSYLAMWTTERLAQPQFEPYDALVLQEATWLRDIARSVVQRKETSPEIATLLDEVNDSGPEANAGDLARAVRLFDWTVRNLQLDQDVNPGDSHRLNSDVILFAWESLLFGRGTFAEKSRVFLLLCRQLNLPVVMLAIDRSNRGESPELWLPALLLGDQLYLFDMRLGTPVPGPQGRGVGTLAQMMEDPQRLQALGLTPDRPYPVKADDLADVVALIDATPPELSQRMAILEKALVGEDKRVLTTSPSTIAVALANSEGVQGVGIWTLPYDGFVVRNRIQQNEQAVVSLAVEHSLFDRRTPLAAARIMHLRGRYDPDDERPGARELYLECRTPEQQIRSVASMPLQTPTGETLVSPTAEQLAEHERRKAGLQFLMRRTKENASFWLGLMAFDRAEYSVSIDFLEKRLLQVTPDTQWKSGALYNLGRAYEARGHVKHSRDDLQRAEQVYASLLDVPMAAAGRLRARSLHQELNPTASPTVTDQPADESPTDEAPVDEAPVDEAPVDEAPAADPLSAEGDAAATEAPETTRDSGN